MREKVAVKGRVTVIERETGGDKYIDELSERWIKAPHTLTEDERKLLKSTITKTCTVDNTLTNLFFDRIVSLMGWSRGYRYNQNMPHDDRAAMANQLSDVIQYNRISLEPTPINVGDDAVNPSTDYAFADFPELIKLGWGESEPSATDEDLDEPFSDPVSGKVLAWKNTWNSKHGSIKPATMKSDGYDYDNSYISRYATIYTTDDINDLEHPIRELGLYFPVIHVGKYPVQNRTIYFDMGGDDETSIGADPSFLWTRNKVWSVLNCSVSWEYNSVNGRGIIMPISRHLMGHDRGDQTISFANLKDVLNTDMWNDLKDNYPYAIVTFTPHIDYQCANPAEFGSGRLLSDITAGGLAARQVLPVSFIKNPNHALTVLWYIYYKIEDQD